MPDPVYYLHEADSVMRRRDGSTLPPDQILWPDGWAPYGAVSVSHEKAGKTVSRTGSTDPAIFTEAELLTEAAARKWARRLKLPVSGW